jgi:hypothetical protein
LSKYNKNKTVVQKLNDWAEGGVALAGWGMKGRMFRIELLYTIGNSYKKKKQKH